MVLRGGGMRSAMDAGSGYGKRGTFGEVGLAGLAWAGIRVGRLWGRVGIGGCIVIAEFGMEGMHFLHMDIVGRTQFKFVHRGRCVEVDVVGEGAGL